MQSANDYHMGFAMPLQQVLKGSSARHNGTEVWQGIADTLATEIRDRTFAEADRLPGEIELAARFAVNRHTLRKATEQLQTEGLVRIEPGRGIFLQHESMDYALSRRTRFSENLLSQGLLPSRQLLAACEQSAIRRVANELKLPSGAEVLKVEMLDEANEKPIGLAISYYPAKRFFWPA